MRLSDIIQSFEVSFLQQYRDRLLPSHRKAMAAMKICRTRLAPAMLAGCAKCDQQIKVPHSCGHRNCPHCQHFESQRWLERQLQKQVPAEYFMLTFTLPAEFRSLAWHHQRLIYAALIACSWDTIQTFAHNDQQLRGNPGAIAVLHTHSRRLDFHPHVHLVVPAAAIDAKRLWRTKTTRENQNKPYLFSHKALAKVFRAKMLDAISNLGLALPKRYPTTWVVDCKHVGRGDHALTYLGRYLYRGVIAEKDIVAVHEGHVTFRYKNGQTQQTEYRTVPGQTFLWLILQHVLPKGFRRARNFGFLHPNAKRLIRVLQYLKGLSTTPSTTPTKRPGLICRCCGGAMRIIKTRIVTQRYSGTLVPT